MYLFTTTETCRSHRIEIAEGRSERREMQSKGDYFEAYKGSEASIVSQAKRDLVWTPDSPGRMAPYRVRVAIRVLAYFNVAAE